MIPWSLSFAAFCAGLALLSEDCLAGGLSRARALGGLRARQLLERVASALRELEETLAAGLVLGEERLRALSALPEPWGGLCGASIHELRSRGSALLPTLKRLRALAEENLAALCEAKARSAQAMVQALGCTALVPIFGGILYWLIPGMEERALLWLGCCVGAAALGGTGALWMARLADQARWAGLAPAERGWLLAAQCTGERVLALVRGGTPPDLAWTAAIEDLELREPELARAWGATVWSESCTASAASSASSRFLVEGGLAMRRSIQASLLEGRPCVERLEGTLAGLGLEFRTATERQIGLLGTQALKPLFICVAPALFGLLALGLGVAWVENGG